MNCKILTVTNHPEHATVLVESAKKHGWDDVILIYAEWKGFGTKLVETYNYLKAHPEIDKFIFCDAFDVVVLGSPEEFENKMHRMNGMMFGMERGLWPPPLHPFRDCYNEAEGGFNYVNSGLYYAPSVKFIEMFEKYSPFYEIDDQMWLNMIWLIDQELDFYGDNQSIFNNHSFIKEGEYTYNNNRVQIMGKEPIFIHFNGKTIDEKFNQMIII